MILQGSHEFQAIVNLNTATDVSIATGAFLSFNNGLNLNGLVLTKTGNGTMVINNALNTGGGSIVVSAGALGGAGEVIGTAGRVDSVVLDRFDMELPVAVVEINLSAMGYETEPMKFQPFTRFPAVKRDLSLLVPGGTAWASIRETASEAGGPLLEQTELFDIYRGKGVPEGFGAFGIRLKFRSQKGNLKGKTVDRAIDLILRALVDRLQIESRGQDQ